MITESVVWELQKMAWQLLQDPGTVSLKSGTNRCTELAGRKIPNTNKKKDKL